jgi:hypothetical protein
VTVSDRISNPNPLPDPHSTDPVKRLPAAVTQRSSPAAENSVLAGLFSEGEK